MFINSIQGFFREIQWRDPTIRIVTERPNRSQINQHILWHQTKITSLLIIMLLIFENPLATLQLFQEIPTWLLSLFFIAAYLSYRCVMYVLRTPKYVSWLHSVISKEDQSGKDNTPNHDYKERQQLQMIRAFGMWFMVTGLMICIYKYSAYPSSNYQSDTIWLFYLMAILLASMEGKTWFVLVIGLMSMIAVFYFNMLTHLPEGRGLVSVISDYEAVSGSVIKSLWLALFSFVFNIVLRDMRIKLATKELVNEAQLAILCLGTNECETEKDILNEVVREIKNRLHYKHVNVFYVESDGSTKCKVSATKNPDDIEIINPPILYSENSIIGRVVYKKGETYLAENVRNHPEYKSSREFPDTQAELVIPIYRNANEAMKLDDYQELPNEQYGGPISGIIGVLDIQHDTPNSISQDEAASLFRVVDALSITLERYKAERYIASLIHTVAQPLLITNTFQDTCNKITQIAYDVFGVGRSLTLKDKINDGLVVLLVGEGDIPAFMQAQSYCGEPLTEHFDNNPKISKTWLRELLSDPEPIKAKNIDSEEEPKTSFPIKENLLYRKSIRFRGGGRTGILFLNYREKPLSDAVENENLLNDFRLMAGLALELSGEREANINAATIAERERLGLVLHDGVKTSAGQIIDYINQIFEDRETIIRYREQHAGINKWVNCLRMDIDLLSSNMQRVITNDLEQELRDEVRLMESYAFRREKVIRFEFDYADNAIGEMAIPLEMISDLRDIVRVALDNSIKYSRAKQVLIYVNCLVNDSEISLNISDNGGGFSGALQGGGGISSMKARAKRYGGICIINPQAESQDGEVGVSISVNLPLAQT